MARVRQNAAKLKAECRFKEAGLLEDGCRKFEKVAGDTVFDVYIAAGDDHTLKGLIEQQKAPAAQHDEVYQSRKNEQLKDLGSQLSQTLQAIIPGDIGRLATLKAMSLMEESSVSRLDYETALSIRNDRETLETAPGHNLQEVYDKQAHRAQSVRKLKSGIRAVGSVGVLVAGAAAAMVGGPVGFPLALALLGPGVALTTLSGGKERAEVGPKGLVAQKWGQRLLAERALDAGRQKAQESLTFSSHGSNQRQVYL